MHRWRLPSGLELVGDSWGSPGNPGVLLLHGIAQTRHSWRRLGKALGDSGFYALAFDARGHGDSDWAPTGDYRRETMAADLSAVVDQAVITHPALVGASLGGDTCLIAAGCGFVDARALILVDVAPRIEAEGVDQVQRFLADNRRGFSTVDEVARSLALFQGSEPARNPDGLRKYLRVGDDGRFYWHWDPRHFEVEPDLTSREASLEVAARRLACPALLVRGALSGMVSDASVEHFLSVCAQGRYVNVAGAAHMGAADRNDVFSDAVVEFLRLLDG